MNTKGFTLIELLVVVLIIGILTSISLPQYQKSVIRARFAQAKVMGDALYNADLVYYDKFEDYNNSVLDMYDLDISAEATVKTCGTGPSCYYKWGFCTISDNKADGYIDCSLQKDSTTVITYRIMRSNGERRCRPNAGGVYDKICAAETGHTKTSNYYKY